MVAIDGVGCCRVFWQVGIVMGTLLLVDFLEKRTCVCVRVCPDLSAISPLRTGINYVCHGWVWI